ncbi:hypothetical protein TNCV_3333211 [Trichonephila clavipes]|nr:hypothetical protein TNCV_3333211 [Trichonephila clavipes]
MASHDPIPIPLGYHGHTRAIGSDPRIFNLSEGRRRHLSLPPALHTTRVNGFALIFIFALLLAEKKGGIVASELMGEQKGCTEDYGVHHLERTMAIPTCRDTKFIRKGYEWSWSQTRGQRVMISRLHATKDPPCKGADAREICHCSVFSLAWCGSLERGKPAQVSSTSRLWLQITTYVTIVSRVAFVVV